VLSEKLRENEPVTLADTLQGWQDRKSSPFYPAVLNMMLWEYPTSPDLLTESLAALDHDAADDRFTCGLLLADHLVRRILKSEQKDHLDLGIPVRYLRNTIERFSDDVTVDVTLRIYTILHAFDSDEYRNWHYAKKEEWTKNILRTRSLQLLTSAMGSNRQHFLVFRDYYQTMRYWGLRVEGADQESDAGKNRFAEWLEGDRTPPIPLIGNSVSADFLDIGNKLFSKPYLEDETLNDARVEFDRVAHEIMPKLLTVVIELNLPASIKNLLRAYSDRFSPPVESPALV